MNPPLHPICELFPSMSDEELDQMAAEIRRRGRLLEPVIIYEGAVLDGRNRLEACRRAGVEPCFEPWNDDTGRSPLEWAIAKNVRRRHLTASQRAVLALQVLPLLEEEAKKRKLNRDSPCGGIAHQCAMPPQGEQLPVGKAAEEAALLCGAGARYVQAAKRVQTKCPALIPHVAAGRINLIEAQEAINLPAYQRAPLLETLSRPGEEKKLKTRIREAHLRYGFSRALTAASRDPMDAVEFVIALTPRQFAALDQGHGISLTLGDRPCVLRLDAT